MSVNDILNDLGGKVQSDGTVDYLTMYTGLELVTKIGEMLLGIACVLIITLIPIVATLEIIYINIPPVRELTEKIMFQGEGYIQKAIQFTLHDAVRAVKEANTCTTGKSANYLYLMIKLKWIFITVLALAVVINGTSTIVNLLISLFSGIIEAVSKTIS